MATADQLFNQAVRQHQFGQLDQAILLYRQILSQQPDRADAMHLLGLALHQLGRSAEGVEFIRRAIGVRPDVPEYHSNLGVALAAVKRQDEAINAFRQAAALRSDWPDAYLNLANAYTQAGRHAESIVAYRRAVELRSQVPEIHFLLGNALTADGQYLAAADAYRRALELRPKWAEAYYNLANALRDADRWDEAVDAYRLALTSKPDLALAENNLANLLKNRGELVEAIALLRSASNHSTASWIGGNLLYALHFHPVYDAHQIYQEHLRWNERFGRPLALRIRPHTNDRSPDRRLRIGYVSPDFRYHPVGLFLAPLIANHDHRQFEIFCYANMDVADGITERIRSQADQWRPIHAMSDEQVVELIRQDGIDVLVDLSLHNQGNRLLVFAQKPAPVQVSYLAYCSTTGLETIDYRLTDPYFDPPEQPDEGRYSERSVRLPRTYWCYQPPPGVPELAPLPAQSNGYVTFGCLNNYAKVSDPTLEAWARVVHDVPNSRLIIYSHEGSHRQKALDLIASRGLAPERIRFVGKMQLLRYFEEFQQIDIALDPFPYPGGTTSCDGLWMGVPVVTLSGDTAVSRNGVSILSNIGLPNLIARSIDEYVSIAVDLARNLPRLAELRSTMRSRMRDSALMDAPQFARDLEAAYRTMWRTWCQK